MEFFIPHATSREEAAAILSSVIQHARSELGAEVTARRIRQLRFFHDGELQEAEVGSRFDPTGEEVIAILESGTYLVCTPTRGVIKGTPILVGHQHVISIEDFEDNAAS